MSDLDDSFAKLLGRQPSDAERQSLYRVRDALCLKNNDALWLVLMALQHYQGQYEKFPQAIAQAAKDTLVNITDFLAVSFSSTDYIGHVLGPRSIELQDTYLRLDETIADFLAYLDKTVGKGNYLVFLTAVS